MSKEIERKLVETRARQNTASEEAKKLEEQLNIERVKEILESGVLRKLKFTAKFYGEDENMNIALTACPKEKDPAFKEIAELFGKGGEDLHDLGIYEDLRAHGLTFELRKHYDDIVLRIIIQQGIERCKKFIIGQHLDVDGSTVVRRLGEMIKEVKEEAEEKASTLEDRELSLRQWNSIWRDQPDESK